MAGCGGGLSWGNGSSSDTDWIGEVVFEGLNRGLIQPYPATLYLMTWYFEGGGRLVDWTAWLDQRLANRVQDTSESSTWLLLARAYAEELSTPGLDPTAGQEWFDLAKTQSSSLADQFWLSQLWALRLAVAGRYAEARVELNSLGTDGYSDNSIDTKGEALDALIRVIDMMESKRKNSRAGEFFETKYDLDVLEQSKQPSARVANCRTSVWRFCVDTT